MEKASSGNSCDGNAASLDGAVEAGPIFPTGEETQSAGYFIRFLRHPLVRMVIGFVMVAAAAGGSAVLLNLLKVDDHSPAFALQCLIIGVNGLLAYYAFQRWVLQEPIAGEGPLTALAELGAGLSGGFLIFSAVTGVVALMGGFTITGVRGFGDFWTWLGIALYSGMVEEALFRGVMQRQIEAVFGTWVALAVTSAFFGFAHLMNPGATLFAAIAIACEAGILLGAAYLLTRRLWIAIGLHMSWNFTQGWVYSIPVSGSKPPVGFLETRLSGPEWLTGGAFGLEASAVAMVVASAVGLGLLALAARNGMIMPPRWKRAEATIQTKL